MPKPWSAAWRATAFAVVATLVAALVLGGAGCSSTSSGTGGATTSTAGGTKPFTVVLDYLPNGVHAGLYEAQASGRFAGAGLDVSLETPSSTSDTIRFLSTGRADAGIMSLYDALVAWQQDPSVTVVGAVVQVPLQSLLTLPASGVTRPAELSGRLVGVTGVPSDDVAVRQMVGSDGGDPSTVDLVTVGFDAVRTLLTGQVAAAIGFWNTEGVELAEQGPVTIFHAEDYGVPPYPELVVVVRNETLASRRDDIAAFLGAAAAGYDAVRADPAAGVDAMRSAAPGLNGDDLAAEIAAVTPAWFDPSGRWGTLDLPQLDAYLAWARQSGLVGGAATASAMVDPTVLPA